MKNRQYCLITVLDTVSETSMPLNEFVYYRKKHYPSIKQYVVVCDKSENTTMTLPDDLNVIYVGSSTALMKKSIKEIVALAKTEKLKVIVHLHQIKAAFAFYKAMFFEKKMYKTVFTVHSVYALRNLKYKMASSMLAIMSDRTTCVSESSYRTYSKIAKIIKGKKISAIQNGVDLDRIDEVLLGIPEGLKTKEKTLIYVGRLIPIKNQSYLVELFSGFDNCKMVFVGAEDDKKEISKQIDELGFSERITVTGMVPRTEVFRLLKNSDIYISSSTVEGLPVSVLEAMYVGLPVILSNIEPHRELADKVDALKVINLDDRASWIEEVNRYLKMTRDELKEIGDMCREGARINFSLQSMHLNYDQIYKDML